MLFDPSIEVEKGEIEIDGLLFGYARSLALRDKSAQFAVALASASPRAWETISIRSLWPGSIGGAPS